MTEPHGGQELSAVFVNIVPSLKDASESIKSEAGRLADEFSKEFGQRVGPGMSQEMRGAAEATGKQGAQSMGSAFGGDLLRHIAGPFKEVMDKVGVDFSAGMKGVGGEGGAALGAGVAGAVVAGAAMIQSDVKNIVKLVDTEFQAFSKVGKDAVDTLMSGFTGAVKGQMPDAMAAFNVLEEATRTGLELPFNVVNTEIDNTIGRVPVLGGIVKSELGAVESAFGGLFSVFDEFKSLGGEWLEMLVGVGDEYTEISRKIAGATLDTGQIEGLTEAVRQIAASGAVANLDEVTNVIGRLNTNIKGLSTDQLKELATTFAEAAELGQRVDPTKFSGILNAFKIPASEATEELTRLVNAARATGIEVGQLTDEMTTSGPALRQLGYDADQTASFFALMTQQGEKGTALVRSMNTVVAKLAGMVDKGQFKSIEEGWGHTVKAVKDYIAAGREAAAIDMLKQLGAGRSAALIVEAVKNNVLDMAAAMKTLPNLDKPLSEAEERTRSLGEAWRVVGNQISAALAPIGHKLAHGLTGASAHISAWLKDNQAKVVGWGVDVTKVFVNGMAEAATFMIDTLSAFGPFLEVMKDLVIKGFLEPLLTAMELVAKPLSLLPGRFGAPFKDFIKGADQARTVLEKGWNFDLPKVLENAKGVIHDFTDKELPKLNESLDETKRAMKWFNDPWFKTPRAPGAPEASTPNDTGGDTGDTAGGADTAAAPPPLSSFPKPGSSPSAPSLPAPSPGTYPVPGPNSGIPLPSMPFPFGGPATPGQQRLRAGDKPLGETVDGIPMPPVPYNGMTLKEYRAWATQTTRYGQEGTQLGTEQQQAQAEIGTKGQKYAKDYAAAQQLQAELNAMSPNDPTRAGKQEKLDKALEKLQESLKASTDANEKLARINQRIADRDIAGPPEPPKPDKGKTDKDGENLGRGIVSGIVQEIGVGDVFKTFGRNASPFQWGLPKLGLGILGGLLGLGHPGKGVEVQVTNWPTQLGVPGGRSPLVPVPPLPDRPNYGGFPATIPGIPNFNGPPVHGGKPPDPLPGPLGQGKAGTAAYIVQQAAQRGFTPEQTVAILSTGLQESGLNEASQGGGGAWHGIFQQDSSYPGRDTTAGNIGGFFDRLGAPGGDIWSQIFALQQGKPYNAPGARQGYMGEIQSHLGEAQGLFNQFAGGATPASLASFTAPGMGGAAGDFSGLQQLIYSNKMTGAKTGEAGPQSGGGAPSGGGNQIVGPGTQNPGYYAANWEGHTGHVHTSWTKSPSGEPYGLKADTVINQGQPGFPGWVYDLGQRYGLVASTYSGHQVLKDGLQHGIDWWPAKGGNMSGEGYDQNDIGALQSFASQISQAGAGGAAPGGAAPGGAPFAGAGAVGGAGGDDSSSPLSLFSGGFNVKSLFANLPGYLIGLQRHAMQQAQTQPGGTTSAIPAAMSPPRYDPSPKTADNYGNAVTYNLGGTVLSNVSSIHDLGAAINEHGPSKATAALTPSTGAAGLPA